jgi:oligosaccharide repeat unit polymerase
MILILRINRVSQIRHGLKYVIALLSLFFLVGALRSSDVDFVRYFFVYLFGGYEAFYLASDDIDFFQLSFGLSTFSSLTSWLSALGFDVSVTSIHLPFVELADGYTNVYTGFWHLFNDFGWFFGLFFILLLNFSYQYCAYKVARGNIKYSILHSLLLVYGVMLFYTSAFTDFRVVVASFFAFFLIFTLRRLGMMRVYD